jgi:hypothetical protein
MLSPPYAPEVQAVSTRSCGPESRPDALNDAGPSAADRGRLSSHEKKEMAVYELVVAKGVTR